MHYIVTETGELKEISESEFVTHDEKLMHTTSCFQKTVKYGNLEFDQLVSGLAVKSTVDVVGYIILPYHRGTIQFIASIINQNCLIDAEALHMHFDKCMAVLAKCEEEFNNVKGDFWYV